MGWIAAIFSSKFGLIAIAALAMTIVGVIGYQHIALGAKQTKIESLELNVKQWRDAHQKARDAAEANLRAFEAEVRRTQLVTSLLEKKNIESEKRLMQIESIKREIANVAKTDDGPVAPVLSRTLERLRKFGASGTDDDQGGASQPAREPAAMPGLPSPAPVR